jgi:hypothetical protein
VGEGIVGAPLPKVRRGTFTVCPVEFWKAAPWSDPNEQTVCDEVRVFDRVLADDEILDLYAEDVPGGVHGLNPALIVDRLATPTGTKTTAYAPPKSQQWLLSDTVRSKEGFLRQTPWPLRRGRRVSRSSEAFHSGREIGVPAGRSRVVLLFWGDCCCSERI